MSKQSPYANDSEAAKALASKLREQPETWLQCRDVMHAWSTLNDFRVVGKASGIVEWVFRDLVCMRCETVRIEEYKVSRGVLEKVAQRYQYPQGYSIPGIPRGVRPKRIVQQEQYRRAMERVAKAQPGEREHSD